jgi:hypothetical protein
VIHERKPPPKNSRQKITAFCNVTLQSSTKLQTFHRNLLSPSSEWKKVESSPLKVKAAGSSEIPVTILYWHT